MPQSVLLIGLLFVLLDNLFEDPLVLFESLELFGRYVHALIMQALPMHQIAAPFKLVNRATAHLVPLSQFPFAKEARVLQLLFSSHFPSFHHVFGRDLRRILGPVYLGDGGLVDLINDSN